MHDSESARVASPSLYETFIHNTLPALTGALNFEPLHKEETATDLLRHQLIENRGASIRDHTFGAG
jgi:hypothetical protein